MKYSFFYEIKTLLFYNFLGLFFNLIVSFHKLPSLFIFFSYPIIKLLKKKLLILKLFEFLTTSWFLSFTISLYFGVFFFLFSVTFFFTSGWYLFQLKLFRQIFVKRLSLSLLFFFIFYVIYCFVLIKIMLFWNFTHFEQTIYHFFELQIQVTSFVFDLLLLYVNFLFWLTFCFIISGYLKLFTKLKRNYFKLKTLKKKIFFVILSFCLIFTYDSLQQVVIFIIDVLTLEIILFHLCYKISNFILKNYANYKTTFKKKKTIK